MTPGQILQWDGTTAWEDKTKHFTEELLRRDVQDNFTYHRKLLLNSDHPESFKIHSLVGFGWIQDTSKMVPLLDSFIEV